jgi:beta-1,4-mannosyl-glycoprotein beta-1,4-N-acetylglucosaminyltransferase
MLTTSDYMKIIDTTTYFEEKLIMDLRLNILSPYVDKFIVSEARFSHSGKEKEIKFDKKDFPKFEDKITHIILEKEPADIIKKKDLDSYELRANSVLRIKEQRDYITNFLEDFSPNDFVIHSDNDEIPNLEKFDLKKTKKKLVIFNQIMFYYKFNLSLPKLDWFGSKACRIKDLKSIDLLRSTKNKIYPFYRIDTLFSDIKHQSVEIVSDGGWHFSNLKNIEELERKFLNDENHAEYESQGHSIDRIRENLKNKSIDYNHKAKKNSSDRFNSTKLEKTELDILPNYLLKNIEIYKDWID